MTIEQQMTRNLQPAYPAPLECPQLWFALTLPLVGGFGCGVEVLLAPLVRQASGFSPM